MARPETPAPAPNALVNVMLRVNRMSPDDVPNLAAACRRAQATTAVRDAGDGRIAAQQVDSLEHLVATGLFLLERAQADRRRAAAPVAAAA
jgi:hypothetical protein